MNLNSVRFDRCCNIGWVTSGFSISVFHVTMYVIYLGIEQYQNLSGKTLGKITGLISDRVYKPTVVVFTEYRLVSSSEVRKVRFFNENDRTRSRQ